MITRITDFSHIIPVSKIDITVGTRAQKMGDFRPGMAKFGERTLARQMGVDPPRETEFGVPSQRGGVDPPRDTDFGVVSPGKGQRVDVTA